MISIDVMAQALLHWTVPRDRARPVQSSVPMSAAERAQAIEAKRLAREDRECRRSARQAAGKRRSR